MDKPRCPECGDRRRLGPDGRCAWRLGCEHRQLVAEARAGELDRWLTNSVEVYREPIIDPAPCNPADFCYVTDPGAAGEELLELVERHLDAMNDEADARGLIPPGYRLSIDLAPLLDGPDVD